MANNRFSGKREFNRRLMRLTPAMEAAAGAELGVQAGKLVQAIKPRVPKLEGDLAASVESHKAPDRPGRIAYVVTEGANDDTLGRKARANEFGRGGENPMEPQPHFFPTYRALKRRIQNAVQRKARAAARKEWGRNP
jgi:hypothetical protein